jgi:hypothetical protein
MAKMYEDDDDVKVTGVVSIGVMLLVTVCKGSLAHSVLAQRI